MSIKSRFGLLLATLLAGFLVVVGLVVAWERRDLAAAVESARAEQRRMIERWLDHATQSLDSLTREMADSEHVRRFLASGNPGAVPPVISSAPEELDFDAIWIYDAAGAIYYTRAVNLQSGRPVGGELRAAARHFFVEEAGSLREISVAAIPAAGGGTGPALGWVVATRRWDPARLRKLGDAMGATVTLQAATGRRSGGLALPLLDARGNVLRELDVSLPASAAIEAAESGVNHVHLYLAFGLLMLITLAVALETWVAGPLRRIDQTLRSGAPEPAQTLAARNDEFGRVARLVVSSFTERRALEREIAERRAAENALLKSEKELEANIAARGRLAQDLHDGIIQSLYAAGMGLSGVRAQLRGDQSAAAAQLEEVRAALNETIRDVRNFITGLEPEALRAQSFRQAILGLIERTQGIQPVRATVDIDDALALRLALEQRVHALLTAREAVSNAVRHGKASGVDISLREQAGGIEFTIVDNGLGFTPGAASGGFGLASIADRARQLGGVLTVDSAPGRGTTVRLRIPGKGPSAHDDRFN